MKKLLKNKSFLLLLADALLIPALFFCEWLSDRMLARPGVCIWTLFGVRCITCGGTHFVNALLNGQIAQAYQHNPLLFIYTAILLFSGILLHLWWLGKVRAAKNILCIIYSIPGLIAFCCSLVFFLFIRNIPVIELIAKFIIQQVSKI